MVAFGHSVLIVQINIFRSQSLEGILKSLSDASSAQFSFWIVLPDKRNRREFCCQHNFLPEGSYGFADQNLIGIPVSIPLNQLRSSRFFCLIVAAAFVIALVEK